MLDNKQEIKKQADALYRQGLRVSARTTDAPGTENLEHIAKLWQKAWQLYRKLGDNDKAKEMEASLVKLYKNKYLLLHEDDQQESCREKVTKKFNNWLMSHAEASGMTTDDGDQAGASMDDEIKSLEKRMKGDERRAYFNDEPAQARYRELVAKRDKRLGVTETQSFAEKSA